MTDMPQMVALYNGMGGGSAAAIGAVELLRFSRGRQRSPRRLPLVLGVIGALIGSISLTGSIIAWAKLDGRMDKRFTFPGQQWFNGAGVRWSPSCSAALVVHALQHAGHHRRSSSPRWRSAC